MKVAEQDIRQLTYVRSAESPAEHASRPAETRVFGDHRLEGLGVAHRLFHPEPEPFEQPGQALPQQDPVLGKY